MSLNKQREFAGIARVMRQHRVEPRQGLVMGRGMYLSPSSGGGTDLEEPPALDLKAVKVKVKNDEGVEVERSFDLTRKLSEQIGKPGIDIPAIFDAQNEGHGYAIAKLRYELQQSQRNGPNPEAFQKAENDLKEIQASLKKTQEDLRDHVREFPDPQKPGGKLELRNVQLRKIGSAGNDREDQAMFGQGDPAHISAAHYTLLCHTNQQLGIEHKDTAAKAARFRQVSDQIVLQVTFLAKADPHRLQSIGGWAGLPQAAEWKELAAELGQGYRAALVGPAMNETNPDEGKNWVPAQILSSRILDYVEEDQVLANFFEHIPMPGPTFTMGVLGSRGKSRKLLENILDDGSTSGATIIPRHIVTKKFDFIAKMHSTAIVASKAWIQDVIIQTDFITREIANDLVRGREDWLINGQLTSALDAVAIATDDIRKMGDGLRYWYAQSKAAAIVADVDMSAGVTAEGLALMFGQQRTYGNRPKRSIYIMSVGSLARMLVLKTQNGGNVVLTEAEAGGRNTFQSGVMTTIFGRPVVTANDIPENADNNGLIPVAANGTKTIILHVWTDAVKIGERAGVRVDYSDDYRFLQYQDVWRAVAREDITRGYDPTTEPFISQATGIDKFAP